MNDKPVAWILKHDLEKAMRSPFLCRVEPTEREGGFVPLYTRPIKQLSDDDIEAIAENLDYDTYEHLKNAFSRAIIKEINK